VRLLMIAAPGGRKGTQGERLAANVSAQHAACGEVLRAEGRCPHSGGDELKARHAPRRQRTRLDWGSRDER